MVNFSVLVPDATVNYIENPSLRYDTTGWNSAGATLTRVLTQARYGVASLRVVTAGTALLEGAYYRVNTLSGTSGALTASVSVRGTGIIRLRLIDNPAGKQWSSENLTLRSDRWTRLSVSGTITGSNDVRLYVETNEGTAKARTFYVDGAQLELKAYPTTYCDGDEPGCRWNGTYHGSSSQRPATTRAGGRWVQLVGDDRAEDDLYVTLVSGLGVAPLKNNVQPFALAPGGFFSNSKVENRQIQLTFNLKNESLRKPPTMPLTRNPLHELRQLLLDNLKPDLTGGDEPIWFLYQDGDIPLYFQARYDGGLEGSWDIRNQWTESFPLRLLAENPFVVEDSREAMELDFQEQIIFNKVAGRVNGRWINMNFGLNSFLADWAFTKRGEIYAAAGSNSLTVANNNAAAVDPLRPVRALLYWDGTKWNALGSVTNMSASAVINSIAIAPNGHVYVCGTFTSIGGVAANRIARWDGSTWNALGTGLDAQAFVVRVANNGDVYVGGDFTSAGGVTCYRIAKWDGSTWSQLGTYRGLNNTVRGIAITPDRTRLYVGGNFTNEQGVGGSTLVRVAEYDINAGTFSALGSGLDDVVEVMELSPFNGILYAGGSFLNSGSDSLYGGIAAWNGSTWEPLGNARLPGENADNYVRIFATDIQFFPDGNLLAVGFFNFVGRNVNEKHAAIWNGSAWIPLDMEINFTGSGTEGLGKCLVSPNGDIYVTETLASSASSLKFSGQTTVNNPGSTNVSPVVYIKGPGTLLWLENQKLKKRLYFNMILQSGEEVTLDFGKGTILSDFRGNLLYTLLPGSDFHAFQLAPGDNTIAAFMINDVSAQMQISFQPQHWSIDATKNVEAL